jgi:hypothetical protein
MGWSSVSGVVTVVDEGRVLIIATTESSVCLKSLFSVFPSFKRSEFVLLVLTILEFCCCAITYVLPLLAAV